MRSITLLSLVALVSAANTQENETTLSRALSLARANRASIAAAQKRVESARQTRSALGAFPTTTLFVGYTDDAAVGGSDDDLVLSQPFDIFGRGAAGRSLGAAEVARAEAELASALSALQFEVISQYSEATAAKALAANALLARDTAQRLYDSIKTLVDEGRLPGVQLMRVGLDLERAKLTAGRRGAELTAALQRLAGLLNVSAAGLNVSGFQEVPVPAIDREQLIARRADLQLLAADIRAFDAEARLARLTLMPELELQARRTPWQETDERYGFRAQLAIPLLDYGKGRSESRAATLRAEAARLALADTTRIAESELDAALTELANARLGLQSSLAIAESARGLFEKSQIGFSERVITLIELLDATNALREVEVELVEAEARLTKAVAEVMRAGGYLIEVTP